MKSRATGTGANAQALAIVEAAMDGVAGSTFGAGAGHNIVTASVQAIVNVANRFAAAAPDGRNHCDGVNSKCCKKIAANA